MFENVLNLLYRNYRSAARAVGDARLLCDPRAAHGESPIWLAESNKLLALDCRDGRLLVVTPETGAVQVLALPEPCFWLVACKRPGHFVAGFRRRIVALHCDLTGPATVVRELFRLPDEAKGVRFNDAKVSPLGQLFTGTMDEGGTLPTGSLYRLDPDGTVHVVDGGYTIPNGPAFCPSGTRLYQADSAIGLIHAYDLSANGEISGRREHIRFSSEDGYPDGMCCDRAGGLWVAHWGAGRVTRFLEDGTADRTYNVPARAATSVCFYGPALDRLAITSAIHGGRLRRSGGGIYTIEPGVTGMPVQPFDL